MKEFWVKTAFEAGLLAFCVGAIIKTINYYTARDKIKAEAEKVRSEAMAMQIKTANELVGNIMNQLRDVRNENMALAKEIAEMKLLHHKEIEEERRSCAEQMGFMNERIKELEANINELKK